MGILLVIWWPKKTTSSSTSSPKKVSHMALEVNSISEPLNSKRHWLQLKSTMPRKAISNLVSTLWLTGLKKSGRDSSVTDLKWRNLAQRSHFYSQRKVLQMKLTGEPRVQLHQWRIKANADHAGPFLLLVHLKVLISLHKVHWIHFQSNNLLTVRRRTMGAKVVLWTLHSSMLKNMPLRQKMNIPTLLKMDHAMLMTMVLESVTAMKM